MNRSSGQHALPEPTAPEIRRPRLPYARFGRRGYDRATVDTTLAHLADYVDSLQADLANVTRALWYREQEIERRRYGVHLPAAPGSGELVHEEQLAWHLEAQRYGDQVTEAAQVQAGRIVEDAQRHAEQIVASAWPDDDDLDQLRATLRGMRRLLQHLAHHLHVAEDCAGSG
jgi:hypothetical protein